MESLLKLIIDNKHILKRQEYTIALLQRENEEVDKNLALADSERKMRLDRENFENITNKVLTKVSIEFSAFLAQLVSASVS